MSTLKTAALRGLTGSADSIQLHTSNQSVTFPGNVTVTGSLTGSGANLTGLSGASIEHKTANTSSATATLTFGTSGDLLSTNTKHFRIAVAGLSSSANMNYGRLQIGYGSTPTYHTGTDAYSPVYYMHARNTGNDGSHAVANDDGFSFIPNVEADYHVFVGTMWGQHLTGNKWSLQSEMIVKTNNEHPKMHRVTGYTTAMSGALTSVRLITDQTFNAGEVSYVGFVS